METLGNLALFGICMFSAWWAIELVSRLVRGVKRRVSSRWR